MSTQLFLLFLIMIIAMLFSGVKDNHRNRVVCVSIISVILALFSGLRTWWYGDLIKYYTQYLSCTGADWQSVVFGKYSNIGLRLYFNIAGRLGISYDTCLFIIAVFVAVILGILVFKYSPSIYWSYLMYIAMGFYMFTYSGLKQTVAMGFIMLAAMAIFNDKPIRFGIWTVIAGMFHAPAFIFAAAYPMAKKKIDKLFFLYVLIVMVMVFLLRDYIVNFLSDAYYEDEKVFKAKEAIGGRAIVMAMIVCLGLYMRPIQNSDKTYSKVFNLMVIAVLIQFFGVYDNVFTRLSDYYFQFVILFIPMIMENGDHQRHHCKDGHIVKEHSRFLYGFLAVSITLFAIWFYYQSMDSLVLESFKFRWEIDPYSLYGR